MKGQTMDKYRFADTDLEVTRIVMGTGNFKEKLDKKSAFRVLDTYLDAGGNFLDTANVYCRWLPDTENCAEQFLGEWFRRTWNRGKVVLATKAGHPHVRTGKWRVDAEHLRQDLEESLLTMDVDHVDMFWFHRDNTDKPIEELIDIGETFVKEGKTRYYGASNFTLPRMKEALAYKEKTGKGFTALSNQWSLAYPNPGYKLNGDMSLEGIDSEYYRWLCETGFTLVPYSATAGGFFNKALTGRLSDVLKGGYVNERNMDLAYTLETMAEKYETTPITISVAILLEQPFQVLPVTAVSGPEQLLETLKADSLKLEKEDIETLSKYL